MTEVLDKENLKRALERVKRNQGAPGIDGMTVDELGAHLKANWPSIRAQLVAGSYQPKPVKRVEIPKPDGRKRLLGIPTVVDRFIQQAVAQVVQQHWEPHFHPHSYGFRPGRNAHQAMRHAQATIRQGYGWVVDIEALTLLARWSLALDLFTVVELSWFLRLPANTKTSKLLKRNRGCFRFST
jgi:RNA-directed DNA polymerase